MLARDNPFAVQRIDRLEYRLAGESWEQVEARLQRLGGRAAVVGPEGSGKTAFLTSLARRLAWRGMRVMWLQLQRGQRRLGDGDRGLLADLRPGDLLVVDGADQLGMLDWRRVRGRAACCAGLVAATHREGVLPTLYRCSPGPELLAELMSELHGACGCPLPAPPELFARHRGNLREAMAELYMHHAALYGPRVVRQSEPPSRSGQ